MGEAITKMGKLKNEKIGCGMGCCSSGNTFDTHWVCK